MVANFGPPTCAGWRRQCGCDWFTPRVLRAQCNADIGIDNTHTASGHGSSRSSSIQQIAAHSTHTHAHTIHRQQEREMGSARSDLVVLVDLRVVEGLALCEDIVDLRRTARKGRVLETGWQWKHKAKAVS